MIDKKDKNNDVSDKKSDPKLETKTNQPVNQVKKSATSVSDQKKSVPPGSKPAQPTTKYTLLVDLNRLFSKGFVYLLVGLLFLPYLWNTFFGNQAEIISISQMVKDVRTEQVAKIQVSGPELKLEYKDGTRKISRKEDAQEVVPLLESAGIDLTSIDLTVQDLSGSQLLLEFLVSFAPFVLMGLLFFWFFRQAKGGQDSMMGMGRSKAKLFIRGKQDTKFKDVGGMDEAKTELEEIVDFLRNPKKYTQVGARTPKGVLLVGPAGTGKTLLARAVAGEAGVQFLSIAGSEFMEMLVGVGASRVRDLFATAKKLAPSIIFIDEIDAIGRIRGNGSFGGHDEREQTLNQILVEMDGFTQNDNVIVMAATNRGDMLDPALIRPGRFDRRVLVMLPDLEERKNIIKIHSQTKPFSENIHWERVAKRTVGFSGADLENMLNEAAIAIARENRTKITMQDIEEASLKVKLGPSKKRLHDELERRMTAYHEGGHAVLAHILVNTDPVHRISIISRGMALGYTLTPPEKDRMQITKSEMLDDMVVMMGGRAAEEIVFNELTAGASNDIERATKIARAMVSEYGMSKLGPMNFNPLSDNHTYSRWGEPNKISDRLQEKVDAEIVSLIETAGEMAKKLLIKHRTQLDIVSEKLLEQETLDGDEFAALMGFVKEQRV